VPLAAPPGPMLPVRRLSDAVGAGVLRVFSPDGRLRSVSAVGRAACLVGCWVSLVLEDLKGIFKALKTYQNGAFTYANQFEKQTTRMQPKKHGQKPYIWLANQK